MKKYKLLKDLPNLKAGAIFESSAGGYSCGNTCYLKENVEENPDWFELVNKWPKTFEELEVKIEVKMPLPATSLQLDSMIAFAKLTKLAKTINGDWVADWSDSSQLKYVIENIKNALIIRICNTYFNHIPFFSLEAAKFSFEHHR